MKLHTDQKLAHDSKRGICRMAYKCKAKASPVSVSQSKEKQFKLSIRARTLFSSSVFVRLCKCLSPRGEEGVKKTLAFDKA